MGDYSTYSFLGRKSSREVLVNCLRVLRNALKIKVNNGKPIVVRDTLLF
jgi:hypothetical protein